MSSFKDSLRHAARLFPPIRRLIDHRDLLQREKEALEKDLDAKAVEIDALRTRLQTAWREIPEIWRPPGHFYSPIPAIGELKSIEDEIFDIPPRIRGVDLNEKEQLELLRQFGGYYAEQPFSEQKQPGRRYFFENPNYSYSDAIVLYCMMRHLRPRRIVEIGSGYSSCAMLDVNELFFDNSIECTFIDPYPQLLRELLNPSDKERIRIVGRKVQDVDDAVFRELRDGDILFIDSSHLSKTGSDVNYIVFRVLPLLREGVYIHVHDVFYPFEYPKDWVYEGRAWNEAYLLRAFLQYNRAFQIKFFNSFLLARHRDMIERLMPLCLKCPGANLWLKKTVHDAELDRAGDLSVRRPVPVPEVIEPFRAEHWRFLGEGWHEAEGTHCWSSECAEVEIGGLESRHEIAISGFSPLDATRLSAEIGNTPAGTVQLGSSGLFTVKFQVPEQQHGRSSAMFRFVVDRVYQPPNDPRKLGLSVTRIEAC
jgi:hypothetical protein